MSALTATSSDFRKDVQRQKSTVVSLL